MRDLWVAIQSADHLNPQITLKALSYFDGGDLPRLPQRLKDRLARAVAAVDLGRLPVVAAEDGNTT